MRQLDGSTVCGSGNVAYMALDDLRRWSAVEIQTGHAMENALLSPIGGDRKRMFFAADIDGDWKLVSVNVEGKAAVLRKLPSAVAAFASGDVGAAAVQSSVLLTTDGATTWRHGARLPEDEDVSALAWLSDSRLLVGGRHGSVELLERQGDGKVRLVWTRKLPRDDAMSFARDGGHVWVRGTSFHRIALADGREDEAVKPQMHVEGFAVCHGAVLAWDSPSESVRVWRRQPGQSYELSATVALPRADRASYSLAAVFPQDAPLCLAFAEEGQAFVLDIEKKTLSPVDLHVTPLAAGKPAADSDVAAPERLQAMIALARQVPREQRDAVFREANSKRDLSPRQRIEWAIQELQRTIDAKKAGKPQK